MRYLLFYVKNDYLDTDVVKLSGLIVFSRFASENRSGTVVGISEGTSKSNLAKARKKLQQAVAALHTDKETGYGG